MKRGYFAALATLVGTTAGAGFLGMPYVISRSGFFIGIFYLVVIALFMLLVKLYLGEVILRTKGTHQLTGYAEKYLGVRGKKIMFLAMIFGIFPALAAYILAEGRSLSFLVFGNFSYSFILSLLFWALLSFLTYIGLIALKKYEKISMIVVMSIIIFICFFFFKDIDSSNLTYIGADIFLPFGIILFSFLAFSAVPEVKRMLFAKEFYMKKTIIMSTIIAFTIYFAFIFVCIGVFGKDVNEIATLSLGRFFSILGILTMFTAFFAQSIAIRDMFRFDFCLGRFRGWILSSTIPLVLFLLLSIFNIASFTQLLSFAGIISGGLTGIMILLMNLKSKELGDRKPEYSIAINKGLILLFSLIFISAVILELFFN